jgi:hypothetical protein
MRNMTSWANLRSLPIKQKEPLIRYYFSSSDAYADATLAFLYSVLYSQKSAEPIYVHDTQGYFQPLLKVNPTLHYLKEAPSSGTNLNDDIGQVGPVLTNLSYASLKRSINSLYQFNQNTFARVEAVMSNFGVLRQTFDVGLVLLEPKDVQAAIAGLKVLQKKTGKKAFHIFVMTESVDLLREFAFNGDKSWTFMSTLRQDMKTDRDSMLLKTLCDISIMQKVGYLAVPMKSSIGKLLYLTNEKVTLESQVVSLDGSSWKVLG